MTRKYVIRRTPLAHNARTVLHMAGGAAVYAVLKADGYGLGLEPLACALSAEGIDRFALTEPDDAARLAALGLPVRELLLLRPVADRQTAERLMTAGPVTFAVGSAADAALLAEAGARLGLTPRAHVQIDTGLGRYGMAWDRPDALRALYAANPGVSFTGIYTHFAALCRARRQYRRFLAALDALSEAGIDPGVRHCCCSAELLRYPSMRMDAVRVGSALLGRVPGGEAADLRAVCWCEGAVETVREIARGAPLGYGGRFRARRAMRVAVVNVGTVHGFGVAPVCGRESASAWLWELARLAGRRLLRRPVLSAEIGGSAVPAIGQPFSECALFDVTDVPCAPGDTVRLDLNPLYQRNMERVWAV